MDIKITEDGIVSFEETKVFKKVKFTEFLENMKDLKPVSSGIIPYGCILHQKHLDVSSYIYEETPSIKVLNWVSGSAGIASLYPISFPFLYWIIKINNGMVSSIRVRSSKTPIRNLTSKVDLSSLPNFYDNGSGDMCRGNMAMPIIDTLNRNFLKDLINHFWASNWNGDLGVPYPYGITGYKDWAEKTLKDPMMWHKLNMQQTTSTLGELLESN
jgi:hypothetical protein